MCVARVASKVHSFTDLQNVDLVIGGSGPNNTETTPAVLNYVLGTKFKIITGYVSSTSTALAVERGEADGLCTAYNTIATRNPDWLTEKKVTVLVQSGLRKSRYIPNVPLDLDLVKDSEDRRVLELNNARLELGRPFVTTPGLHPERLEALRKAFNDTIHDDGFADELRKSRLDLAPVDGPAAQMILEPVSATPRPLVDRLNAALAYRSDAVVQKQ